MGFSSSHRNWKFLIVAVVFATCLGLGRPLAAADLIGIAFVQPNASIYLNGRTIYLYGIYIPSTGRDCRASFSPVRCGNRTALALDREIEGFVRCRPVGRYSDGSLSAFCFVRRDHFSDSKDLAAELILDGWALAAPGAPFQYVALERIAMAQRRGVWRRYDTVSRYYYD
jgi:endonuclease YncB( thermonuclease family)